MAERPFYVFGPFHLDATGRLLLRGREPVPLPPKAIDTLLVLVENAGTVVSKEHLLKQVARVRLPSSTKAFRDAVIASRHRLRSSRTARWRQQYSLCVKGSLPGYGLAQRLLPFWPLSFW